MTPLEQTAALRMAHGNLKVAIDHLLRLAAHRADDPASTDASQVALGLLQACLDAQNAEAKLVQIAKHLKVALTP